MLDPAGWLAQAQVLDRGRKARVNHDCGDGRTLLVEHGEGGFSAYCFRCSEPGFVPHPKPSLAERIARLSDARGADTEAETDPRPPMPAIFADRVSEWPSAARVWLYKAGFSNDRIAELGYYWCPRIKRVVLPIFDAGQVVYWQARGFDPDRAKYINPPIDKPVYRVGSGPLLVLTEDMLSAAKVGSVTEAWSIMGTSAPDDAVLTEIIRMGKPVRVWLDPDGAGRKGRRKLVPKLRALGIDAKGIETERDPKLHNVKEIRDVLGIH